MISMRSMLPYFPAVISASRLSSTAGLRPTLDGVEVGHVNDDGWALSDEATSSARTAAELEGRRVIATNYRRRRKA